ncbi:MAG: hypothetical protein H0X66_08040 [Verrucomicrobia bacterium]|nr:hypothetical protein [Verrucomicrobiota bacterium]
MPNNSSALIVPSEPPTDTNVAEATLRDIKPPVHIPDYWLYLWIALGVLALVIIGYLLWRYWLKKALQPKPIPVLPPHVRARRRLKEAMAHIADPKLFVSAVSDAVRLYLEESFDLRAPERTTEEFLYELQTSNRLGENVKGSLNEFLSRCDLVKFAKYEPTQAELEDIHNAAMRIVEETEPKPFSQSPVQPSLQQK